MAFSSSGGAVGGGRVSLVAVAFGLLLLVASCGAGDRTARDGDEPGARRLEKPTARRGARLFGALCAGCHGRRGDGRSKVAERMFPAPRDLTRGEYRFRTTTSGALPTRADIVRTLRNGLPGTAMPSWREQLSGAQLMSLALYLETLSPRFAEEKRYPGDRIIPDPHALAAGPASAATTTGARLYKEMACGKCHGERGRGDGPAAHEQKNSDGSPAHVFDFTYGVYKGGKRPYDVYRTFVTGLDGTPMPSFEQSLPTQEERWALVHYVLSLSRKRGLWFYLAERPTWWEPAGE